MSIAGYIDVPLELFSGLVTDLAPSELPAGVSPDCQDVIFELAGAVRTRPGLLSKITGLVNNVNYIKTYIPQPGIIKTLALDSSGQLWQETADGAASLVAASVAPANSYGKSTPQFASATSQFAKEWLAFSDGKFGVDMPRQFDNINLDRVSQVGPGAAPTPVDNQPVATITGVGASRSNNVVTITTTATHGFMPGGTVVIAGVSDSSFFGTFVITTVPSPTTFTYAQVGTTASSGNGTATFGANIVAGLHKVAVIFVTRQGYFTAPSPFATWTAAGGHGVTISNCPIGPANVVSRIFCFTAAGQSSFFYLNGQNGLPQMQIFDNSSTTLSFDFTDAQLQSGTNVDYLFRLVELGECAGVVDYNGRLIWWGERNKINNFLNLTFDGGFSGGVPLGWTAGGNSGDGSQETTNVVWGSAYKITGSGVAGVRVLCTQSAYQDYNGVPILRPNVQYSVRVRARTFGSPSVGSLSINLTGTGGSDTTGLVLQAPQTAATYTEYSAVLGGPFPTVPSTLALQLVTTNALTNGAGFYIDNIEVFPTNQPFNDSLLRCSRVFDPESYDGTSGTISVSPNNGQRITNVFKIKERLFIVKERSLYVTQDTGNSEPSFWTVTEVSNKIGTPSINGISVGEDWAILADRSGAYLTDGSEPRKLSQEIQPTWDIINDNALHTIWTVVDTRTRRMYFGVPTIPTANIASGGASRASNIVTVTTTATHNFIAGGIVAISGVTDPSFNGTFVVASIPNATTFTYAQAGANSSSGNGTATSLTPNKIYALDYRGMNSAAEIADGHAVQLFIYTGTLRALSKSRRWVPWNITSNSGAVVERFDGTAQVFIGNGSSTGKIYQLSDTQFSDDGVPINSYYTTYFFLTHEQEGQFRITPHRKLVPYLTLYVEGNGSLGLSAFANSFLTTAQVIPSLTLSNPGTRDLERPINLLGERIAFKFGTNSVGSWFKMQKFIPAFVQDPAGPVRGA